MTILTVRLGTTDDIKVRSVAAGKLAAAGRPVGASPPVEFSNYDDMHRILAPLRLAS